MTSHNFTYLMLMALLIPLAEGSATLCIRTSTGDVCMNSTILTGTKLNWSDILNPAGGAGTNTTNNITYNITMNITMNITNNITQNYTTTLQNTSYECAGTDKLMNVSITSGNITGVCANDEDSAESDPIAIPKINQNSTFFSSFLSSYMGSNGTCGAGTVVQNVTHTGVQCAIDLTGGGGGGGHTAYPAYWLTNNSQNMTFNVSQIIDYYFNATYIINSFLPIGDQRYNETVGIQAINASLASAIIREGADNTSQESRIAARAYPGACYGGQFVYETTTSGVNCDTENDPEVGAVTNLKWCLGDGSAVQCSSDTPTDADLGKIDQNSTFFSQAYLLLWNATVAINTSIAQNSTYFSGLITALQASRTEMNVSIAANSTYFAGQIDALKSSRTEMNASIAANSTLFTGRIDANNISLRNMIATLNTTVITNNITLRNIIDANSTYFTGRIDANNITLRNLIDANSTFFTGRIDANNISLRNLIDANSTIFTTALNNRPTQAGAANFTSVNISTDLVVAYQGNITFKNSTAGTAARIRVNATHWIIGP